MKNKIRLSNDCVEIYEDSSSSFVVYLCSGVGFSLFSFLVVYSGITQDAMPFVAIGILFLAFSALILLGLPKVYRDMRNNAGDTVLMANTLGLSIKLSGAKKLIPFSWDEIESLSLVEKFDVIEWESRTGRESTNYGSVLIVRYQEELVRPRRDLIHSAELQESPRGSLYSKVYLSQDDFNHVESNITKQACLDCRLSRYVRVVFNYSKKTEELYSL